MPDPNANTNQNALTAFLGEGNALADALADAFKRYPGQETYLAKYFEQKAFFEAVSIAGFAAKLGLIGGILPGFVFGQLTISSLGSGDEYVYPPGKPTIKTIKVPLFPLVIIPPMWDRDP